VHFQHLVVALHYAVLTLPLDAMASVLGSTVTKDNW